MEVMFCNPVTSYKDTTAKGYYASKSNDRMV